MNLPESLTYPLDAPEIDQPATNKPARPTVQRISRLRLPLPRVIAEPSRRFALFLLLALSWVVPLCVLAIAAWWTWRVELVEYEERIKATLTIVEEHVRKVFDTDVLAIDWIRDRTDRLAWDEIERSRTLQEFLALIDRDYDQISSIYMIDATGRMRINDHEFPLEQTIMVGDRDYFRAVATEGSSLHISEPYRSRRSGALGFSIARPRHAQDGRFDGLVAVGIRSEYFEQFLRTFVGATSNSATLLRSDGTVLARYPAVSAGTKIESGPASPAEIREDAQGVRQFVSPLDGVNRLVGVRLIAGYPLAVSYGVDLALIFKEWFTNFLLYGIVALTSGLVLSIVTIVALRGERRERMAVAAWQSEQLRRLEAEADARRMSKYEALGTLAGGIAHHFNNLLPAVTGHLEIAAHEAGPNNPAVPRLQRLSKEISDARNLIRKILLYSRRDVTAFAAVDLSTVVQESAEMIRASLPNDIDLRLHIAPNIEVFGDAAQLSQLVINLLTNARDALEGAPGAITVTVGYAPAGSEHAGADGPRRWAQITCSDTGRGMSSEIVERAFDPFFTTRAARGGTGLGLAICDGIVRSHDGDVRVDSREGRGTTFIVSLPLAAQGQR